MAFNTLSFLFFFFPISLILYFLFPQKLRNIVLLVVSLVFYSWGDISNILFILFSALFSYISAIEISTFQNEGKEKEAKISTIVTVGVHVALLAFFKYAGLMSMPLGISFYTFSVLSYIFDVYRKKVPVEWNIVNYFLYVTFFPKVISGPIVEYKDFHEQLEKRFVTKKHLIDGTELFLIGLFKKVLLADQLGKAFQSFSLTSSVVGTWMMVISYGLQLYFDFSGYSDMAIGLAKMFGFDFKKNFDEPYSSRSISEFWRRWHISLGAWFRDYVYIPLGGNRVSKQRHIFNLLVVWLLTGIWHGNTVGFMIWGLYHGFFVIGEKYFFASIREKMSAIAQHIVTVFIVFIGWIFFFAPSINDALLYLGRMIGIDASHFMTSTTFYYLYNNIIVIILAIVFCCPIIKQRYNSYVQRNNIRYLLHQAIVFVLFIVSIAYMVSSTYSSFLYFAF
ncbi:MAG: MBOAT family protein [Sharpea porci]|uniref:MBOAT family O-acyltransferase n=1 Tax=Sharpea porci TaxID=2652286 RepID=UPI002408FCA4|nr:MBOAT family O-acyltransferase [Sharpea porci]MDD6712380.1 MBOAT family protein [Sharpea porci]